ncbi:Glutamine--fructose-6-phosphate aminotransferase [isomerizing] [Marinobacterium sp. xm-a-121]|uniref:glutamine--fructose-6-phosphate transaminase (isomerizing) n=1 Tax=unclassified Marinobacterium TaxID=2644139 RepID=UPI00156A0AE2|nr:MULTISPECIES: glutamine--fructose-6-phosphate transaminase (isomerizing) [unclassified Marinobacterium]NRP38735.1 Glutamine--fructose-6-phosphate aminotransferase [isomerizing] [Marinobacterium sp. xm-a-121]NRP46509.1 Glutamine--fructose-6-phosphate aminotransferase [isomerizing] [Marinobacterium sp. xm-d-543]NRP60431.1 Glutamine--fructose-6-phosphate aminotransferase [isomerizing] [Marinobacterium sp. xm-d-564]NRP99551.1 Glutamine--fructose-6-phosphate aminotransferase [isomerizing] [Marino
MCGIVGAVSERQVSGILLEGLSRLEYRGYDSAGMAIHDGQSVNRLRRIGKVQALKDAQEASPITGTLGIAHTRWATHGVPAEHNAHPHMSGDSVAVVHNGIIENFEELKAELLADGFQFSSETDTEVIAHLLAKLLKSEDSLLAALPKVIARLEGAFALGVVHKDLPDQLYTARKGSPLVVGVGIGENFIASDQLALLPVTDRFMFLEDGDIGCLTRDEIRVWDATGQSVERAVSRYEHSASAAEKGEFKHFMMKEIYEQPTVMADVLEGRLTGDRLLEQCFGAEAAELFDNTKQVLILACGTSYHAGMVARYWIEELANLPCSVEVASEFRYRKAVVPEGTLLLTISQSGETADTLAALRDIQSRVAGSLAICNVPGSSLVRESQLSLMTQAGPEIGVASTKAFTSQLVALMLTTVALARRQGLTDEKEAYIIHSLRQLPSLLEQVIGLDDQIQKMSEAFAEKHHSLFLGRGALYPVAMEGALKLKEISYIHAEAYPAGELKHGPLALVDKEMPVIAVAPRNDMLDKLKANLQEVRARGGELFVFAEEGTIQEEEGIHVIELPVVDFWLEPLVYTIPLQLLSYHVAVLKGTDVDQPRNLAKSVTVE